MYNPLNTGMVDYFINLFSPRPIYSLTTVNKTTFNKHPSVVTRSVSDDLFKTLGLLKLLHYIYKPFTHGTKQHVIEFCK